MVVLLAVVATDPGVAAADRSARAMTPGGRFAMAVDCRTPIPGEAVPPIAHRGGLSW